MQDFQTVLHHKFSPSLPDILAIRKGGARFGIYGHRHVGILPAGLVDGRVTL